MRFRSRGSRAIGLLDRDPVLGQVSPGQDGVPPGHDLGPGCAAPSTRCARSVFATSSRPDVSLSSRWTMPSRPSSPVADSSAATALEGVDERSGPVSRVPGGRPCPPACRRPGRRRPRRRSLSGMSSAQHLAARPAAGSSTTIRSPSRSPVAAPARVGLRRRRRPSAISVAAWFRERARACGTRRRGRVAARRRAPIRSCVGHGRKARRRVRSGAAARQPHRFVPRAAASAAAIASVRRSSRQRTHASISAPTSPPNPRR